MKRSKRSTTLRVAGKVFTLSKQGYLIVKLETEHIPKPGERVYDRRLRYVGTVVDVIGNVSSPYAVIKPISNRPLKGLDETLYLRG